MTSRSRIVCITNVVFLPLTVVLFYILNQQGYHFLLLRRLADDLSDGPRFGACYDMAHSYLSQTPLTEWNQALLPYVRHLHINDNNKTQDTHRPVGSGSLPWNLYAQLFASCPSGQNPSVLIEVRSYEDLAASVSYLKEHHLHPFDETP